MENKILKNDEQSFLSLSQRRERTGRMNRFFAQAIGDEDVSRREASVKHFDMGANRYQAVVYSEPVHFRNSENEEWQEIDNTLEEFTTAQGRQVLRNRANRVRVEFPCEADGGSMASVTASGKTFSWRFENEVQPTRARLRTGLELKQERLVKLAQRLPRFVGRTLESLQMADLEAELETEQEKRADIAKLRAQNRYDEVLPGVSVRYTLNGESVKEDIILANAQALANAALRLPADFAYEVTEAQQLRVLDKADGAELFSMSTPVVYDAEGKETIAQVVLTDCGGYVRMAYAIDPGFMAEAAYPVTIDPIINSSNPVHNIQDTTLGRGQSSKPYTENHMKIGKYGGSVDCVGLLQFNILAIPKACDTVISAVLQLAPKSSSSSKYIGAYEVLKPWTAADVNWLNFNPEDETNIAPEAIECVKGSSDTWLSFDLTNLYRRWCTRDASGASRNNGVAFHTPRNISGDNYSELYSSDASASYRPVMYVNYISHAGLEGWWQYEQMGAGRAGTVYSDLFNGNMVLEHSDTVMTGNRNPVSVNHYYNSCLSTANSYGCGFGWRTDAHQKITAVTHNNRKYFVWHDGDGTEHYFEYAGAQPYKDAEGMDLELTYDSEDGYFILADKQDNQMRFNIVQSGLAWLAATRDACDNRSIWSYVSGHELEGRIDKITDPVGRVTQFAYNAEGLLSSIKIPAAADNTFRTVAYTYDSSQRLTGVSYSELGGSAPHTTYAYEGSTKLLTKARNFDGVQVNVGYETTSLYGAEATDDARRVVSLETVATNASGAVTMSGAKQVFEYGAMTTEVTAVENAASDAGKKLYYQFNDSGNVVCVRDDLGFARFTKFDSGIENKPSEESKLRKAVVNRLRKPDLNGQWEAVNGGGTATKDTSNLCLNCNSVKLTKTGAGEVIYRQQVSVEADREFTLSAYVKTSALVNGGAFLRIRSAASNSVYAVGDPITGTTDPAVGNELPTDGWERVHVTMPKQSASTDLVVELVCDAASGTAWFACPQLESGVVANAFNLVSNGDFRYTTTSGAQTLPLDWEQGASNLLTANTGVKVPSPEDELPSALEGNYVQVEGAPNRTAMGFVQYLDMTGKAGDVFVVGGWADGKSIPNAKEREKGFSLALDLKKKSDGGWITPAIYPFNDEWVGWQQSCYATAAGADYTQIRLYLVYSGNCNEARFSNIFLHREAYGTSFGYDDKGNVLSTSNLAGQQSKATYDIADNVKTYVQPGRDSANEDNEYWSYYGSTDADKKKHLPWRTRTPMNMTDYFSYDSYGNQTSARRVNYATFSSGAAESANPYIRTENTYTSDGNYTATTKDARGNVVTQSVNAKDGTLTSVTDPNNQTVEYAYDASKRVTAVQTTGDGKTYRNGYTYENDRIKTVSHNTTSDTANDVTYTFDYDALGRKTTVKVGSQVLSTNVYENDRSGLLSEVQYGNGGKVKYAYDDFDRLTGVTYDGKTTDQYTYEYGANGETAEVIDNELACTTRTDYDLADRPCQTELIDNATGKVLYKTSLKYDKWNNLKLFSERVDGEVHKTEYTYDRDNRITEISIDGDTHKIGYTYDELGRVTSRIAECGLDDGKVTSTYGYVEGGYGTNSTSQLMASITQKGINFAYEYDSRGNITSETRNGLTTGFAYDALGQLVRVNDPHENATWVYEYDRGGNIVSKARYAYTTGTLGIALENIAYSYGDSNWKDKLTSYSGRAIDYDAIGNMTSDGIWSYEWKTGRQLDKMNKSGVSVEFKYDHTGMRTQKEVTENGVTVKTCYMMHGQMITHMSVGSDTLHFIYDTQSVPAKVMFNDVIYTYLFNAQGDIVGLLDNSGTLVVEYKYNAWGKLLETTGTLAATLGKLNPFRYRCYVYDEESGLYYLRTRYYNPELQRFINPDVIISEDPDLLAPNLYTYCLNAPINNSDDEGTWGLPNWAKVAIGTALIVGAAVVATVATGGVACFAAGAAIGAAKGAIAGAVGGAVSGVVQNRIQTGNWEGSLQAAVDGAADGYLGGAIGGFITGGLTSNACFIAGTLIHAECGLVPIEEIKADQMVWAEEPESGEQALKRVVRTFVNEKDEIVHVQVNGETITCTIEHPFYVKGKGWTAAKDLKLNDKLELQNGENAFVDAIRREKLAEPIQVFNFEVEDFHTYYVSAGCVLVHNMCKPTDIGKAGELKAGIPTKKTSFNINGRVRIPDYTNKYRKFIVEVKNVRYQSNTLQLRDFADIAIQNGYRKVLVVRKGTRVANTVYKAGWTVHRVL